MLIVDAQPVVELTGLTKRFGLTWALRDVNLVVRPHEIHGLLGQNGCGKSTLIKVLAGFHTPESGQVRLNGEAVTLPVSGKAVRHHRMRFVHQDLALIPSLTVLENFLIDDIAGAAALKPIEVRRAGKLLARQLERWGIDADPRSPVDDLSRLARARLAIFKAVRDFDDGVPGGLLVLDEPTAFLPADQAAALFTTMRQVADNAAGVLFVSHNLDEILEHTDSVTVLRDGSEVGTVAVSQTNMAELVQLILGRPLETVKPADPQAERSSQPIAVVRGLAAKGLAPLDLDLYRGEVVGVTGLISSGFDQIPYLIFGAQQASAGTVDLMGRTVDLTRTSPHHSLANGIAFVPSDRLSDAMSPDLSVAENLCITGLPAAMNRARVVTDRRVRGIADRLADSLDVRPRDTSLPLQALSGGNQQKVVLAKWIDTHPDLLLISEPTQGVDIGARAQIAGVIQQVARSGCAVLCASSDLDQLAELCTRVLVFRRGALAAELSGDEISKQNLMHAMFGITADPPIPGTPTTSTATAGGQA